VHPVLHKLGTFNSEMNRNLITHINIGFYSHINRNPDILFQLLFIIIEMLMVLTFVIVKLRFRIVNLRFVVCLVSIVINLILIIIDLVLLVSVIVVGLVSTVIVHLVIFHINVGINILYSNICTKVSKGIVAPESSTKSCAHSSC
jgi:hypothetical protein